MMGDLPTLVVEGEIDLASVPMLTDALRRLLTEHGGRTVAVDLDAVSVLDDVGLGILLGSAGRARELGGDLVLVCTSLRLRDRFERTRLALAIDVRDRLSS